MTWDWEISEREMMEAANAAIFYDRPDLQFKFDGSAPPLILAIAAAAREGRDSVAWLGAQARQSGAESASPSTYRSVP